MPRSLAVLLLASALTVSASAQGTRARVNVDYGIGAAGGLLTSSTFEDDITTGTHRALTVSIPLDRFEGAGSFNDSFVGIRAGYTQVLDDDEDSPRDVASPAAYLEISLAGSSAVAPWLTMEAGYDVYNFNTHGWVLGLVPTFGAGAGFQINAGPVKAGALFGGSFTSFMEGAAAYLRGSAAVGF
ncbi:MAG TPA: hypothetical protein VD962_00800 [Rubricoccaceae bacterium]|nr:hypothetical protein [Rubricoccaceae bacterium]